MTSDADRAARRAAAVRAVDALRPLGPVTARAMFGGHGVFLEGAMVGLVAGGALYLKVDAANRELFEGAGLEPFRYDAGGRIHTMSYHRAPEPTDRWDVLGPFAESAHAAALRALAARAPRRR